MSQTNVRTGPYPMIAAADLAAGILVKITNAAGVAKVAKPAAIDDYIAGVTLDEVASGGLAAVAPLNPNGMIRVRLKGTCNPGDVLVNADPATAADAGKVRALPTAAGTYRALFIAAEIGVDGQLVLAAASPIGNITVTE
jgi:hypothetical protein